MSQTPHTAGIVQGMLILMFFGLAIVSAIVVSALLFFGGYSFDMIYIYR